MKLSFFSLSILSCINLYGAPWLQGNDIPSRTLEYNPVWIDAPGEKRFYARVNVLEGEGLLSGADSEGVRLVAVQFRSLDSADHLKEAKDRAVWHSGVYSGKIKDVLLATKELRRFCDILLPAELRDKVSDGAYCKHENDGACKRYSADIIVKIKALAQAASTTHQAWVMVPEYRYHY